MDLKEITNNQTKESEISTKALETPEENDQTLQSEAATEDELPGTNHDDIGHASDSTLSDNENDNDNDNGNDNDDVTKTDIKTTENDDATESESSDIEIDLSDVDQDYNCQWKDCNEVLTSPNTLSQHIFTSHANGELECKWDACSQVSKDNLSFTIHIRDHTNDYPYFCPVADCSSKFLASVELFKHLGTHDEAGLEDKVAWQTYLNEVVATGYSPLSDKDTENLGSLKGLKSIDTQQELQEHVSKSKIDFLKIQNVQIDDIVSEPVKKKGRTANSVINADLRSEFNEIDNAYKEHLLTTAEKTAELEKNIEQLPTFETINSLKHSDQLTFFDSSLQRKLLWALEVQTFLKKDLDHLKNLETELWEKKEALLQANIDLELQDKKYL